MDTPVAQPTTPQVAQPVPPPPPVVPPPVAPTKPKNVLVTVVMVLIALFSLCVAGYFAYQYMQEKQQAAITTFEACSKAAGSAMQASYPAVCVTRDGKRFTQPLTPEEQQNLQPSDPTADLSRAVPRDWKTYTNSVNNFSFKYPSTWTIDTKGERGDERQQNIQIKLTKDKATIGIIADLVGIGGGPRNVPYEQIVLWGGTYYKQYSDMDFATNTKRIDISDEPHGLGVFRIGTKTYMISLTYPAVQEGDKPDKALSEEFDHILSTFTFSGIPATSPSGTQRACTLEAKICPDGSSVGRTGPNCEFAPCP